MGTSQKILPIISCLSWLVKFIFEPMVSFADEKVVCSSTLAITAESINASKSVVTVLI
jgi:hypothetical protein